METVAEKEAQLYVARNLIQYLSTDAILTPDAHTMRETALHELPKILHQFNLNEIAIDQLCTAYMMCSYGHTPQKHAIKPVINSMLCREMDDFGMAKIEISHRPLSYKREKPICMVVTNYFAPTHAMYRCFAKSLRALKKHFHVINLSLGIQDAGSHELFDHVINCVMVPTPDFLTNIETAAQIIRHHAPDVILYADIAMHPIGIFLSNLRLAPIQATIPGHPVSSYSPQIDYFLAEDAYTKKCNNYSEQLRFFPTEDYALTVPAIRPLVEKVASRRTRIIIPATVPKLNVPFLQAVNTIQKETGASIQITTNSTEKMWPMVEKNIRGLVENCTVYPAMKYEPLIRLIASCEMFLMPFPFAGTNLTIDCLSQGLPGIALAGDEILSYTAPSIMQRLGMSLPTWTANTVNDFIRIGIALAKDKQALESERAYLLSVFSNQENLSANVPLFAPECNGIANILKGIVTDG